MTKTMTSTTTFRNSAKYPIRFDTLHPGSAFRIKRELSRGMGETNDGRLYRKAESHEGFYATELGSNAPCILMPHDLVMPVVPMRNNDRLINR